ncbi:unnamed protein product [Lampetra fluviatilis]
MRKEQTDDNEQDRAEEEEERLRKRASEEDAGRAAAMKLDERPGENEEGARWTRRRRWRRRSGCKVSLWRRTGTWEIGSRVRIKRGGAEGSPQRQQLMQIAAEARAGGGGRDVDGGGGGASGGAASGGGCGGGGGGGSGLRQSSHEEGATRGAIRADKCGSRSPPLRFHCLNSDLSVIRSPV